MSAIDVNKIYYLYPQGFNTTKLAFIKSMAEYLYNEADETIEFQLISFINDTSANEAFGKQLPTHPIVELPDIDKATDELAALLEKEYAVSFNHLWFPEKLQKNFGERITDKPYDQIVQNCYKLHELLKKDPPAVLIHDQDVVPEFYFSDRVCKKLDIPQIISVTHFFQRSIFYKKLTQNRADVYELEFDESIDKEKYRQTVEDLLGSGTFLAKAPEKTIFKKVGEKLSQLKSYPGDISRNLSYGKKFAENVYEKAKTRIDNLRKNSLYADPDYNESFIFLPLHNRYESTLIYRSQPYTDQEFLVKLIARNLPYGTKLYIREHPEWRKQFDADFLKELSEVDNVKLISPDISIHKIIKAAKAVAVMNNTTGYEATMQGKAVVAFSPSPYAFHEENFFVSDLYKLDEILQKAVTSKPDIQKNHEFLYNMYKHSMPYHEHASKWNTKEAQHVGKEYGKCVQKILKSLYN